MSEEPRTAPVQNVNKVITAFVCFFLIAVTDSVVGALVPALEADYQISDLNMSYAFLSPVVGYVAVALLNGYIVSKIGLRGVSLGGLVLCLLACALAAQRPPYVWLVIAFAFTGLGAGTIEASWNAWMGALPNAHVVLGLLHGFYGVGGFLGPAAVYLLMVLRRPWQVLYAFLAVGFALALALVAFVFEPDTQTSCTDEEHTVHLNKYTPVHQNPSASGASELADSKSNVSDSHTPSTSNAANDTDEPAADEPAGTLVECLCNVYVLLLALFMTLYVGIEVGFSGWLVTFMIRQRNGAPASMPLVASSFWGGLALGRAVLGFVTEKFKNQERVISVYLVLSLVVYVTFMFVSSRILSSVLVGLVGILVGPVYPSVMVIATRSLPRTLAVPGLGIAVALSGSGVAIIPFIPGALIHHLGIRVFLPFFLCMFASLCILWFALQHSADP